MFHFNSFAEKHLPLLRQWLNAEHIKNVWHETSDDEKLKVKFLEELPTRGVFPYVIEKNGTAIGFIQYYDAKKVGGGWWENERPGTFGIDLMIGSIEFLGKGFGKDIIQEFIAFVRTKEPSLNCVIIDPDPKNIKAIRAFEKAGFTRESEIKTPGGTALLMRMTFAK